MEVIIAFVPPEVLRARQSFSEQTKHSQNCITAHVFIDLPEHWWVNAGSASKAHVQYLVHLVHGLNSLIKTVQTTSFLSKLTFSLNVILVEINYRQRCKDCCNVILRNESISVKIVDFKHKISLLIK
jgi:hypothetical protein